VRGTLASARGAALDGFDAEVARLPARALEVMASEDAAEGMRSFAERREAVFKGT
jgi:enoyl-CoA hydratase